MSPGVILVVEDNPKNLKLVRDVLSFAGYDVIEAGSAESGLELAAERQPDLVLMDLQLPGMDGMEAVQVLKAEERTREIPVVALTAFAMADDRDRAMAAGFDSYVAKPVSPGVLRAVADRYLERSEEPHV